MTDINHLEKAKELANCHPDQIQDGILNALIANAETNEGRLTNEIEMTARLHTLCGQAIKIAEQLERMNNQELRTEKLDFHSITRRIDK